MKTKDSGGEIKKMGEKIIRGRKDGHGKGVGMPNGLRRNKNTEPCQSDGIGEGKGEGRGKGKGRRKRIK